jgi:two-component system phosphate regulon response regulator OmpR
MTQNLLMIEDDARLAGMVAEYLEQNAFKVGHAPTGQIGLDMLSHKLSASPTYDLVILDLMLPDMDGLEVCRRIRALEGLQASTPVLMLTAKGDPMDRVIGLEIGADDYLPKPFEPRELLARIRAILRRGGVEAAKPGALKNLSFGSLEIDRNALSLIHISEPTRQP